MPSRRSVLRTAAVTASGVLAGCASFDRGIDGYVQLKSIEGWYRDGERHAEELFSEWH